MKRGDLRYVSEVDRRTSMVIARRCTFRHTEKCLIPPGPVVGRGRLASFHRIDSKSTNNERSSTHKQIGAYDRRSTDAARLAGDLPDGASQRLSLELNHCMAGHTAIDLAVSVCTHPGLHTVTITNQYTRNIKYSDEPRHVCMHMAEVYI